MSAIGTLPELKISRTCRFTNRELKQQTFLSSRTSDCRGGLDRQRRFWREILMLSKTRSPTQTALFCLYFLTGILDSWSFLLSMPRLKDGRNWLLIAHNNSLPSDEDLLLLLDENSSENPQFSYEKYERFDIDNIYHWHWTYNIEHYTCISKTEIKCSYIYSCIKTKVKALGLS